MTNVATHPVFKSYRSKLVCVNLSKWILQYIKYIELYWKKNEYPNPNLTD